MANLFERGDVVVLKSGGVPMTVDMVPGEINRAGYALSEYHLVWQKGATALQGYYPEHVLEKFVAPAKK